MGAVPAGGAGHHASNLYGLNLNAVRSNPDHCSAERDVRHSLSVGGRPTVGSQPELGCLRFPPAHTTTCSYNNQGSASALQHCLAPHVTAQHGRARFQCPWIRQALALRLDQLPAEVRAGELAPCLSLQGRRRHAHRGRRPASNVCCSAAAGPAGGCGAPQQALQHAALRGPFPTASLQVRTASDVRYKTQPAVCYGFALTASDRRFKQALAQPFWSTLEGRVNARLWQALGRPGAPPPCLYDLKVLRCAARHASVALRYGCTTGGLLIRHVNLCPRLRRSRPCLARALIHSLAGAGTPEEAGARRWLRAQGGAVKRASGAYQFAEWDEEAERPVGDSDGARVSTLLANLPALTSLNLVITADTGIGPTPPAAAVSAFLARAACAIGRCSSLQQLHLRVLLRSGESDQLPEALARELARARTLEEVDLWFGVPWVSGPPGPAIISIAHLVAGLAGLTRLRALRLAVHQVGMEAALPACVSCLAQLTSLTLKGFYGLRCAPGWARLPALARLSFEHCVFAGGGEDALPGMDALVALTCPDLSMEENCITIPYPINQRPGLRALPTSLWRLSQLCSVVHSPKCQDLAGVPRSELPVAGLPSSGAPCCASLRRLSLTGHNMPAFPPGILTASRLTHLNLSPGCFEQLPEGVSALTALEELRLGRHAAGEMEIGGTLDARALGGLAGFPNLRSLTFDNCSVLLCPGFQAAAAHPCLEDLELITSYPACGASCAAVLAFATNLLQQGRPGVLGLLDSAVDGAGRQDSRRFRTALKAVGFPLRDCSQCSLHKEEEEDDMCPEDCHQDGDL